MNVAKTISSASKRLTIRFLKWVKRILMDIRIIRQMARGLRRAVGQDWHPRNKTVLQSIKDIHKGQRCFIIGNGPSLNKLDLAKLKNDFTFGVNAIYLNYERMGYHPTYYVVEDTFVAEDRQNEIREYEGPKLKFFGSYLGKYLRGAKAAIWMNVIPEYKEYPGWPNFSTDISKEVWVGGSVTYICMQIAYHMGFDKVYLIGFDHNYVVPKGDMVNAADIHSTRDDVNHFHPDYFGKGKRWHDPKTDRMERGYTRAGEMFARNGRKIYNATAGGKLEYFERVDFDNLFNA